MRCSPALSTCLSTLALFACPVARDTPARELTARSSCHEPLASRRHLLVYTRTTGFRHGSISAGVAALQALGAALNFQVTHTEDPARFTAAGLAGVHAVVFFNTTGDVLGPEGEAALRAFVEAGGGFAGVHAAADTEYEWPWYGALVGAWFLSHPPIQDARLTVTDSEHPSTRCLPRVWQRTDEWYDFRAPPAPDARILLTIDESSYTGGRMGLMHPMSWARDIGRGRAWYTALGHTAESYAETHYLDHLAGGMLWVLGGRE